MDTTESLLRAILATVARSTFPPADIYKIVAPVAGSDKQLAAYNLCDGKTPQTEIGKRAKLDKGSLSRSISRWIEAGIVVRVGRDQYPLHVYPLTKSILKLPIA
jgi:DNA-binding HxlR family transcriptional regulator